MKLKRKGWYDVTCFNQGVMYEYKRRKWLKYEDIKGCSTSHAQFNTFRRARKNALALHTKLGCQVILTHWYYRKGVRYCEGWVIKERV